MPALHPQSGLKILRAGIYQNWGVILEKNICKEINKMDLLKIPHSIQLLTLVVCLLVNYIYNLLTMTCYVLS